MGITADTSEVPTKSATTHGLLSFVEEISHLEADLKQRREIRGGMGAKEIVEGIRESFDFLGDTDLPSSNVSTCACCPVYFCVHNTCMTHQNSGM